MKKVIIIEDHPLIAEGLEEIVNNIPELVLVGTASDGKDGLEMIRSQSPAIVLTDLNIPELNGLELLDIIKHEQPDLQVLILTMYNNPSLVQKAIDLGASGFLVKEDGKEIIQTALEAIMRGGTFFSTKIKARKKAEVPVFQDNFIRQFSLSGREIEILGLVSQSLTNKEIAAQLYISETTVQTHRRNLKRKLGAKHTADLVRFALENKA
ncbi:MAG: response regulator transcription factor [Bacteroidota bacterium]